MSTFAERKSLSKGMLEMEGDISRIDRYTLVVDTLVAEGLGRKPRRARSMVVSH